jgi:hypothetical protein
MYDKSGPEHPAVLTYDDDSGSKDAMSTPAASSLFFVLGISSMYDFLRELPFPSPHHNRT